MNRMVVAVVGFAVLLAGCGATSEPSTVGVDLGAGLEFRVVVARTEDQRRDGLTGTDDLAPRGGMLFVFHARAPQEVWMAGMTIPLDIAWILDEKGRRH